MLTIEDYACVIHNTKHFDVRIINEKVDTSALDKPAYECNYAVIHKKNGTIEYLCQQLVKTLNAAEQMNYMLENHSYTVSSPEAPEPSKPTTNGNVTQLWPTDD